MKIVAKSNYAVFLLLIASLFLKIFSYENKPLYWDESTYIAIGKYIYSFGEFGFKEAFRPIIWPLILGLLWKLKLNIFLIGKFLEIGFGLGVIYLVYLIGRKVFNESVGLLAAAFFSLSSTYHYWNNTLLTDIPSTCIGLLAVYLLLNKKYSLCGLIGALAFLFRFTQLLTLNLMFVYLVIDCVRGKKIKPLLSFAAAVSALLIPFLIYNYFMYGNPLAAFIESKIGYSQYTVSWFSGICDVLRTVKTNESWIFIFIFPAMIFIFLKQFSWEAMLLLSIGLFQIVWVGKLPVEIVRYLIACLPYFYILSAFGIYICHVYLLNRFKILSQLFTVSIIFLLFQLIIRISQIYFIDRQINSIQLYAMKNADQLKDKRIWMGNPTDFVYADLKMDVLMYYPRFDLAKINYLNEHLNDADYIFLDSKNMNCVFDKPLCEAEKRKLMVRIESEFKREVKIIEHDPQNVRAVFKNKRLL